MRGALYRRAVNSTLRFYESWILPDMKTGGWVAKSRLSLKEAKLAEFRLKKKLLNPYERDLLLDSANQEERLALEDRLKRTTFQNA